MGQVIFAICFFAGIFAGIRAIYMALNRRPPLESALWKLLIAIVILMVVYGTYIA